MKSPYLKFQGLSRDQRTNVWHVICPSCGYTNKPHTTMCSTQVFECNKCHKDIFCDYNEEVVKIVTEEKP